MKTLSLPYQTKCKMKNENETITVKIFRDDYKHLVDKKFETKLTYTELLKAAINAVVNNPELWDEEIEKINQKAIDKKG